MTRDQIKAIALASGFTERQQADGSMDLNGYVYAFAEAMHAEGQRAMQERAAVAAWSSGMDQHKKAVGMPLDLREVGSACASAIRALEVKPS